MWKVDWCEDRHIAAGLQDVRFPHVLSKEFMTLKVWKDNYREHRDNDPPRAIPAPHYEWPYDSKSNFRQSSKFYDMMQTYRLGVFLWEQFAKLRDSINQTCQYYYEINQIPQELQLPPVDLISESMQVYYQYENEKFYQELDGGGYNTLTRPLRLEQTWLIAQIFGSSESIQRVEAQETDPARIKQVVMYIKYLECVKLGHILWDFVEEETWTVRLDGKYISYSPFDFVTFLDRCVA